MKLNRKFIRMLAMIISIGLLIWGGRHLNLRQDGAANDRKIAFYQDSMHPWIKSSQPGKCTVCDMDLTPIYEGNQGLHVSENMLVLSSNNITVLNVQTAEVQRRPLRRAIRVSGILEAGESNKRIISASRDGRVERLSVPYAGFEVRQGQPLVNYFIPDLLSEARRYVMLAQNQSTAAKSSVMDMSNPLLASMQNLRLYGFTEGQIENLAKTGKAEGSFDMLSPISGTVIERNVSEGQYVSQGTRMFTIVDLSVLWFRFDAYEQDLPWLRLGQQVELTVPGVPGKLFTGPICFMEPFANEATRSAKVRVDIANPLKETGGSMQRELRQQQYAEGRVLVVASNLLVVPSSAVLYPGSQAFAYVDKGGGSYEMRTLKLGQKGDSDWEVLAGLEEGETVVVSGNVLMDAQAQFNRGADGYSPQAQTAAAGMDDHSNGDAHLHGSSSAITTASAEHHEKTFLQFFDAADGVSKALAADSLEQLKPHVARLPGLLKKLSNELGDTHEWHSFLERLQSDTDKLVSTDLDAARTSFLPFSTRLVDLVQRMRSSNAQFRSMKVYHCPMAPEPGLWFQKQGPLKNPYYGAKMLRCGEEIKLTDELPKSADKASETLMHSNMTASSSFNLGSPVSNVVKAAIPARFLASAQPINSRDHSLFDNRMNNALSARFSNRLHGTNTPTGHATSAGANVPKPQRALPLTPNRKP